MDYDAIFEEYYTLYRAEATAPASSDDEYSIGLRLANEALSYWSNYDDTQWKTLFTTKTDTIVAGDSTYTCETDFKKAGGLIKIKDSNGNTVRNYRIVEPNEVQFMGDEAQYAYFDGYPGNFVLHLNPAPDASIDGMTLEYVYYKTPSTYTTGTSVSEIPNPRFIVHRMLQNRFRASRNPYYASARDDAESALRIMQLDNNSGTWGNPWSLPDNSGSTWGA